MDGAPHDPVLTDRLADFAPSVFESTVYRATRMTADPTAFSPNGGRWAPPSTYQSVPVLYTSRERDGAVAEMASWLAELTPRPTKPIVVHHLHLQAEKVIRLDADALRSLGVDLQLYSARAYAKPREAPPSITQKIGAAASFLGFDGLIVPSARWRSENVVIFENQEFSFELTVEGHEKVDWTEWLKDHEPNPFDDNGL